MDKEEDIDSLKTAQKSVATKLYVGDYLCEFLDPVSEDYECKVGEHIAKEPTITSCCGEVFCSNCISTASKLNNPCPHCNKSGFTTFLNVKLLNKIHSLAMCCVNKDVGCFWRGTLEELDNHISESNGDCEYICIQCPSQCGELVKKRDLDGHLTSECAKRDYSCNFCGFKATYEIICSKHAQECKFFTIECPNGCGETCDRSNLKIHTTKECPLADMECEFREAGCLVKFKRQDEVMHMDANIRKHLALMGSTLVEMKRKLENELEEKDHVIKEIKEFSQREIQRQGKEIFKLKIEVDECKQLIKKHQDISEGSNIFIFPFFFTVENFSKQKTVNQYTTPPKYTHPQGYKFFFVVHANGVGTGSGTHISLSFVPTKRQDISTQKWPAKVTFTVQLMNQYRDADHITLVETLVWSQAKLGSNISLTHTLVPHSNLDWNPRKQTLYLKDDCLKFCIRKVDIHSL